MPAFANEFARDGGHRIDDLERGRNEEEAMHDILVEGREDVLEIFDEPGAEHRTDQRADPAQDGHQHHFARRRPLHALGAGQRIGDGEQGAGEAGIHARDDEGGERIGRVLKPV